MPRRRTWLGNSVARKPGDVLTGCANRSRTLPAVSHRITRANASARKIEVALLGDKGAVVTSKADDANGSLVDSEGINSATISQADVANNDPAEQIVAGRSDRIDEDHQSLLHDDGEDPEPEPEPLGHVSFVGTNKKKGNEVIDEEEKIRGSSSQLKCVFNYEDRYRFSRILSSDCLIFDSHFESGNLAMANRVTYGDARDKNTQVQEYDLSLHHDINSLGHNQWFYFSVSNTIAGCRVKLNIVNLGKSDSLYNNGLRPLMFSQMSATEGKGWHRVGEDVRYYRNKISAPFEKGRPRGSRVYNTLTFTHTFERSNDVCFFAMCYPYTYSDLQHYLYNLQRDESRNSNFRRDVLCRTLADNTCDVLTVTEGNCRTPAKLEKRLGIVITARVHPGESNASWIMQGIIDFLTGDGKVARQLRKKFVFVSLLRPAAYFDLDFAFPFFSVAQRPRSSRHASILSPLIDATQKIVPMLNPDGVINGNYRTSLAGVDLNRRWDKPDPELHPTIWAVKDMVKRLQKTRLVIMQTDIHGHSRKEGLFVYGCVPDRGWYRYLTEKKERARLARLSLEVEAKRQKEMVNGGGDAPKKIVAFGGSTSGNSNNLKNGSVGSSRPTSAMGSNQESAGEGGKNGGGVAGENAPPANEHSLEALEMNASINEKLRARMFPRIFDSVSKNFLMDSSSFKLQKNKASTCRIVMYEELGIICSYTLESSFSGLDGYHFSTKDLLDMGRDFCLSLVEFADYLEIENANTTRAGGTMRGGVEERVGFPLDEEDSSFLEDSNAGLEDSIASLFTVTDGSGTLPYGPLNALMQKEIEYLQRKGIDGENDAYDSAGSDSDPSGDNLTREELRKQFDRKERRRAKAKKASHRRPTVRKANGSSSNNASEVVGGGGRDDAKRHQRKQVSKLGLDLDKKPTRPAGMKNGRRSFSEGLYSKTPRYKANGDRDTAAGEGISINRAQSASAADRRSGSTAASNGRLRGNFAHQQATKAKKIGQNRVGGGGGGGYGKQNGDIRRIETKVKQGEADPRFVMEGNITLAKRKSRQSIYIYTAEHINNNPPPLNCWKSNDYEQNPIFAKFSIVNHFFFFESLSEGVLKKIIVIVF